MEQHKNIAYPNPDTMVNMSMVDLNKDLIAIPRGRHPWRYVKHEYNIATLPSQGEIEVSV